MNATQVEQSYTVVEALPTLIPSIEPDSIVSRTFSRAGKVKGIIFGFDAGQELSEHTSSQTAILHIMQGEATVTLGDDVHELGSGSWVYMPPRLKHSVVAKSKLIMLLELIDCS